MRPTIRPLIPLLSLLGAILGVEEVAAAAAAPDTAAVAAAAAASLSTTVTLRIPATAHLPNPHTLPPSTHVTLTSRGRSSSSSRKSSSSSTPPVVVPRSFFSAPLSVHDTFVVRNVTPGSYLVDVHCATHAFAPLRLDVVMVTGAGAAAAAEAEAEAEAATGAEGQQEEKKKKMKKKDEEEDYSLVVRAWETYRGNAWDNRGEAVRVLEGTGSGGGALGLRLLGAKNYFMERSTFSVLSILRNPMILLGLVSMAIFIGMPKLVENMDPEMRAEWEERQKTNPMSSLMGGGGGPSGGGSFDMAAFLSGSSASGPGPAAGGNGGAGVVGGAQQQGGDNRAGGGGGGGGGRGEGRKKK